LSPDRNFPPTRVLISLHRYVPFLTCQRLLLAFIVIWIPSVLWNTSGACISGFGGFVVIPGGSIVDGMTLPCSPLLCLGKQTVRPCPALLCSAFNFPRLCSALLCSALLFPAAALLSSLICSDLICSALSRVQQERLQLIIWKNHPSIIIMVDKR
jgi:hypothetical protein